MVQNVVIKKQLSAKTSFLIAVQIIKLETVSILIIRKYSILREYGSKMNGSIKWRSAVQQVVTCTVKHNNIEISRTVELLAAACSLTKMSKMD